MSDGVVETIMALLAKRKSFTMRDLRSYSVRDVREAFAQLRRKRHLLLISDGEKYRLAKDAVEVFNYTIQIRRQIRALYDLVRIMETEACQQFGIDLEVAVGCADCACTDNARCQE